jgi:hypothetical protein
MKAIRHLHCIFSRICISSFCRLNFANGFQYFQHQRSSELCSAFSTDDGFNIFTVADVVYDKYIVFYLVNVNNEETFQLVELYGRVFLCHVILG